MISYLQGGLICNGCHVCRTDQLYKNITFMQKRCFMLLSWHSLPRKISACLVVCFQAFSVCEQLRTHSATEISELERIVGSQQELLAALNQTYPEQVTKNVQKQNSFVKSIQSNIQQCVSMVFFSPFSINTGCLKPGLQ